MYNAEAGSNSGDCQIPASAGAEAAPAGREAAALRGAAGRGFGVLNAPAQSPAPRRARTRNPGLRALRIGGDG